MDNVQYAGLQQMDRKKTVRRPQINSSRKGLRTYEGCARRKMPRIAIPKTSNTHESGLLDLVNTDIASPLPAISKGGAKYIVTFITDTSRRVTAYPIRAKSDCFAYFKRFQWAAERCTGRRMKSIRSDRGA
eukprot:IDg9374t1